MSDQPEKEKDKEGRGRRARVRTRPREGEGAAGQGGQQRPAPAAQGGQQRPAPAAQGAPRPAAEHPRAGQRGAQRNNGGRGQVTQGIEQGMQAMSVSGNNNGNNKNNGKKTNTRTEHPAEAARGNIRGKRKLEPLTDRRLAITKPENLERKVSYFKNSQEIRLYANYFEMDKRVEWHLFLYHAEFLPEEDRTFMKKKLLRSHKHELKCGDYIFDGQALFSTSKVDGTLQKGDVKTISGKREEDDANYKIKLTLIKEVDPLDSMYIQILNIIVRRCQEHLGFKLMGRNYYDKGSAIEDREFNLNIWPGYVTSIRRHENNILMCADVSHKFLRQDTALDFLAKLRNNRSSFDPILGSIVMTKYNEKTYRVDSVDQDINPMSKFKNSKGEMMTYFDYYKERYNITIRERNQPMLHSVRKDRDRRRGDFDNVILVPELCIMTGLSDEQRNNFRTMQHFAQYTRVDPNNRYQSLIRLSQRLSRTAESKNELQNWALEIAPDLLKLKGKLLPEEAIVQGLDRNRRFVEHKFDRAKSDWTRETRSSDLNEPVIIEKWVVLHPSRNYNEAFNFCKMLNTVGEKMGLRIRQPEFVAIQGDGGGDYVRVLTSGKYDRCNLVMAIFGNIRGDKYAATKKYCACKMGVPSQFLLYKTISNEKRVMSVATKVAIQINAKLGGEVWNVRIPAKELMVIGYDTYHDSMQKKSSFGALVASYNANLTKYYGHVTRHMVKEELTTNFNYSLTCALEKYKEWNDGNYPKHIIIYRDGVGDSQIEYVKFTELGHIELCLKDKFYKDKDGVEHKIKLTFIIVSKRINTKFFTPAGQGLANPPPGTCVDTVVTFPERYDFFLVSQSVNQGTVNPTSFNIIHDEGELKPEHLQRLAFKLCHLYYNWQGTIRVPAPCQYAHKLAYMSGTATHMEPAPNMHTLLWYL